MYLCNNLGIDLFVVGDDKQSIYIWRGAYPEAFRSILKMDNFRKNVLRDNFRSCLMIQNYSNLLTAETRDLYKKSSENDSIILVKTNSSIWVKAIEPYVDLRKEIALLRFTHASAKSGADELSNIGTPFTYIPRTPISEITTNSAWLYNAIAQYFILSKYSVYDFMDEIPEESIGDRKIKRYLESKLDEIREAKKTKNDEKVIAKVREIAEFFGYEINEDHVRAMLLTIINDEYHPAFHMDELSHVAITFHSSKGLEFDQVIVFANDYQLNDEVSIYNHYVAVTRAKSKLIIVLLSDVNDWAGRQYCKNLQKLFGEAGVWLEDVMRIV
jgi:Superfamily I DNA and RNA helicases